MRRGGVTALGVSAVTVPLGIAAIVVPGLALAASEYPAPFARLMAELTLGFLIGLPLIYGGPLTAFALAATGKRPGFLEALALALRRVPRLAILGVILGGLSLFACTALFFLGGCLVFGLSHGGVVAAVVISLVLTFVYAAYFLIGAVASIVERDDVLWALGRAHSLGKGHLPLLLVCSLIPAAVPFIARPGAIGQDTLGNALGSSGLEGFAVFMGFAGAFLALLAATALAASAYAVLVGSPDDDPPG